MTIYRAMYGLAFLCTRLAVVCGTLLAFAASAWASAPVLKTVEGPPPVAGDAAYFLDLYGDGFETGAVIQWNGQDLQATTFISSTRVSVQVPGSLITSPSDVVITVKNPDGAVSNGLNLAVIALVENISPTSVPAGTGDFIVTVFGRGFPSNVEVKWNSIPLPTTFVNSTQLTVQVEAARVTAPALVMLNVWCPGVGIGTGAQFRVTAPTLGAMSPSTAVAGGPGFMLTVTGSGFVPSSNVLWNNQNLPTTFISSAQLTAQVPASAIAVAGGAIVTVFNNIYTGTNDLRFTITQTAPPPSPPSVSSISPNAVTAGGTAFTLTVTGSGFQAGSIVQWNGSSLTTSYLSGNSLSAAVPASLIINSGVASVTVLNPGGLASNTFTFTINPPAFSLFSLWPNSIVAGGPFLMLTVNGSGFVTVSTVHWNGSALATSYFSVSQLVATVPASLVASAGSASVTVVNPGGISSNALVFTVSAPTPTIDNIVPSKVLAGGPAFTLFVNGDGFLTGSIVQWNGSALQTANTNGLLTASVPASLIANPGNVSITVLNPGGRVSNPVTFAINGPTPIIYGLFPNSATTGGPAFTLTVSGTNFVNGSAVKWNGSSLPTTYVSEGRLTALVGASLIASYTIASVTVVNPDGLTSNTIAFAVNVGTPTLSGVFPTSATAGGPAFTLTANGSGFLDGSTVQWSGTALATTYVNGNQLSATVGATLIGSAGTAGITVHNPAGTLSNTVAFTINTATPSLSSLSPSSATAGGPAFTLNVNGSGFLVGSIVQWNGSALTTRYVSGNQLTASVEAGLIATTSIASVTVLNPGGTVSSVLAFAINAATPSLSELAPNTAAAGGPAFTLTVNGSGFLNGSTVQWNGIELATTYVNGSQLSATVGSTLIANTGVASVVVVNPKGITSNGLTFTVTATPAGSLSITTLSPLPAGAVGSLYFQALSASGGVGTNKTWAVMDVNHLPPGISLVAATLTGTPTAAGTFTFTLQVTDDSKANATKQFSLMVNGGAVSISPGGIVNAGSYGAGSVSPGEIVTIFGSGLGPSTLVGLRLDVRGCVSTSLADTLVLFDGAAAPILYTQAGQVSAIVPYEVSGKSTTQVQVIYQGRSSNVVSMPVSAVMPGIFTVDASGHGQGAIVNQDGTPNSASNPAAVGTYVSLYATGEGQTNPPGVNGKLGGWPAPLPVAQPVSATIGGVPIPVLQYAGGAPGLVAGVLQLNILIPEGVPTGASVPIVIRIGEQNSQADVVMAIK